MLAHMNPSTSQLIYLLVSRLANVGPIPVTAYNYRYSHCQILLPTCSSDTEPYRTSNLHLQYGA